MKFIKELINVIDSYKSKTIEIIGNETKQQTKISEFYDAVKHGQVTNDQQALELLYDSEDKVDNYRKLKSRLKTRLINTLFFIGLDQPQFTDIQRAYYYCYKNWAAIRIMFGRSAKESAISLSQKTIRQAIRFEFTEIIINLSRVLRLYYSTVERDKKKFNYYNELLDKNLYNLKAELESEKYYSDLLIDFVTSKATKTEFENKAKGYATALEPYLEKVDTYNFLFFTHTVFVLQYEIANDNENVILASSKAIEALKSKPFSLKSQLYGFTSKAFASYLKLERYEEAEKISIDCLQLTEPGTINWFKYYQIQSRLLFYTQKYTEIPRIVNLIVQHSNFVYQSQETIETWKINEAYTYIYCIADRRSIGKERDILMKRFRLGKFLNEVPAYSKDKRGANIHILIIQILIFLGQKKYDQIIDRINALKSYSSRYLSNNETLRSNCFINILLLLPKTKFRKLALERHAKKYITKLHSASLKEANQTSEFEIVPFEHLLDLTLRMIK